jgi:hypothetical protein
MEYKKGPDPLIRAFPVAGPFLLPGLSCCRVVLRVLLPVAPAAVARTGIGFSRL